MEYVLLIWIHASIMSSSDSMTSSIVSGFKTSAECNAQGKLLEDITNNTLKVLKYRCIQQEK